MLSESAAFLPEFVEHLKICNRSLVHHTFYPHPSVSYPASGSNSAGSLDTDKLSRSVGAGGPLGSEVYIWPRFFYIIKEIIHFSK